MKINRTNNFCRGKEKIDGIHPEIMIFIQSFRNAIISYKEQWLAQHMKNKPVIVTVMGAEHVRH